MKVSVLEAKRLGHQAVLRLSWLLLVASVALSTLLQVAVAPPTLVGYLTVGATPVWLLGSFAVLSLLYRADISADPATTAAEGSAEQRPASAELQQPGAEVLTQACPGRAPLRRTQRQRCPGQRWAVGRGCWAQRQLRPSADRPVPDSTPGRRRAERSPPHRGRLRPGGQLMTTTPSVDRAAASRLVAALEHAWSAIRRNHPDVPQVVIVVGSGSNPRGKRVNLDHFAAGR